jgi:vacuolar-type H+-ATPase subunit C/Vma6
MLDAGERAYAYTKACGIIGKSFIGKRISDLASLRTITELDRTVFPDRQRESPGHELLADMEGRILQRTVQNICAVITSYTDTPRALIRLLQSFEYADLKTCLHYLASGKKEPPSISPIGKFASIKFENYPDIKSMLQGTDYEFVLEKLPAKWQDGDSDLAVLETELDEHYYLSLIDSLNDLSAEDRKIACMILGDEISLRNCMWAFRLRTYFNMTEAETGKHLMDLKISREFQAVDTRGESARVKEVSLAAEAFESLEKPLDQRSAWRGWKWEKLLNQEKPAYSADRPPASGESGAEPGTPAHDGAAAHSSQSWEVDPRYFQNSASFYLYRLAFKHFHRMPFSVSAIFCFIKLKQFEEDLLTSITEGLSFSMTPAEVLSLLEVSP